MPHHPHLRLASRASALFASTCALTALPAQVGCYGLGSTPIAAHATPSPLPLGCAAAPSWPMWHLLTPPHRAPASHPGFRPGDAHALPQLLVAWRCTGWLLLPVVPDRVRTMGYVIDQAEWPCTPLTP